MDPTGPRRRFPEVKRRRPGAHLVAVVLEMPELIMTNMFMHCFARNTTKQNIYTGGVGGKDNARTHA